MPSPVLAGMFDRRGSFQIYEIDEANVAEFAAAEWVEPSKTTTRKSTRTTTFRRAAEQLRRLTANHSGKFACWGFRRRWRTWAFASLTLTLAALNLAFQNRSLQPQKYHYVGLTILFASF